MNGNNVSARIWPTGLRHLGCLLLLGGAACIQYISPPTEASAAQRFADAERLYGDARDLYFRVYVTEANGSGHSTRGVSLTELRGSYEALRDRALERLNALDRERLGNEDQRALDLMRTNLAPDSSAPAPDAKSCTFAADEGARTAWGVFAERVYGCYGRQQSRVVTPSDTADRLTVLSRLGNDTSSARRQALWLALRPVWESVNGTNTSGSPWRQLVRVSAARWRTQGSPVDAAARSLGIDPAHTDELLTTMLDAWRRQLPGELVEPWDWYYANSAASRRLSPRVPVRELERTTEAYYASFGASPRRLGVQYDLVPRAGKTPVAFTQFGGLPRQSRQGPHGADPFVFATYREGGLGNLVELLHETGHAIHIAAVNARPAFADWPDSDPLTEALADVPALEAYEGPWQVKYLGDSARTAESLREKYSGVMMDVAWALFELRMHQDPERDPNVVWTDITERYLHIAPHPEWSWWAMRGQLVNSPGYMMNYALGAMLVADIRSRVAERKGGFVRGGPKLYGWLADELYRFGRAKASRDVLAQFLGRPVGPEGVVRDVERIGGTTASMNRPAGAMVQAVASVQYRSRAGVDYRAQADTGPIARATTALAADPHNVQRFIDLGVAQSGARQFREALVTFTRGLGEFPNHAMLYRWRGHRYLSVREFGKAQTDLERGLQLDSTNYGVLYHLGIVRFVGGDFAGAAALFKRGQSRAPDAGELAGSTDWLWMSLSRAGQRAEAQAMLDQHPDSLPVSNAYAQRLKLYRGQIGPDQLITAADTADVQVATLNFGLGNWYLVRGDTARARTHFERSVQSGGWPGFGFIMSEVELTRR